MSRKLGAHVWSESGSSSLVIILTTFFSKNNYNTDFVRWNTHSNTDSNSQTNSGPVTTATIPYIRGTSETSVTVNNNNSPIQDYVHPDDQTQPFEMTPGFKPFTREIRLNLLYVK